MRNLLLTTIATLFIAIGMNANTANRYNNNQPFVFVESGIEFAVFQDGQFDFNVLRTNQRGVNVRLNTGIIDFSFNTGRNYNTYVQYDDYGAVIQIENTPVFYDYYGRVNRIGNIHMNYNHRNLISRIGNMHLSYNQYGEFRYANGIINNYNVNYRYATRHGIYRKPLRNRAIVHHTPYRRTFTPVRCNYVTYRNNYNNNYRRTANVTRNYRRPGNVINKTNNIYKQNNNSKRVTFNNNGRTTKNVNTYNTKKQVVKNTNRNHNTRVYNNNSTKNINRVSIKNNTNNNKRYAIKNVKRNNNSRTVASNETRNSRR